MNKIQNPQRHLGGLALSHLFAGGLGHRRGPRTCKGGCVVTTVALGGPRTSQFTKIFISIT